MKLMMLNKVEFNRTDISEVLQFLSQKTKEIDPEKKGLTFILKLPDSSKQIKIHREVRVLLEGISVADFLKILEAQTGLTVSIDDDVLYLHPE